jgi:Tol biopolymer transport system component
LRVFYICTATALCLVACLAFRAERAAATALPLRPLTFDEVDSDTAINEFPVPSPDGRYLTFQHSDDPHRIRVGGGRTVTDFDDVSNWDIYRIRTDGTGRLRLTDDPAVEDQGGWSPDSKTLVYRFKHEGHWQLWLMNADGSHKRPLVQLPHGDAKTPVFSESGREVLFFSNKDGVKWNLYTVAISTGAIERVTEGHFEDKHPQFVPNHPELVVFHTTRYSPGEQSLLRTGPLISEPEAMMNVARLDRLTGEIANLSQGGPGDDCRHAWPSPDGRFVAYHCNRFEAVSRVPFDETLPAKLPNVDRRRGRNLWIATLDGSKRVCLTCGDGRQFKHPSWKPDGSGLYFVFKAKKGAWNVGFIETSSVLRRLLAGDT